MKFHKEHLQKGEEFVGYCKGRSFPIGPDFSRISASIYTLPYIHDVAVNKDAQAAKELLLLAATPADQKKWIARMSKKLKAKLHGCALLTPRYRIISIPLVQY